VYAGPDHPHEAQVNESRKKEEGRKKMIAIAATTGTKDKA
jgi:hypothetical protein